MRFAKVLTVCLAACAVALAPTTAALSVPVVGYPLGATNAQALASGGGTTTFRTGGGRFFGVVTIAAGTVATTCYDNTAASGTKLLVTPATTVVGTVYPQPMPPGGIPFTTGLTCDGATSSAALLVMWAQ